MKNFNGRRLAANTWKTKVAKNYIETNVINIQPISTSKNKTTKGKDSLKSSQLLFGHMEKAEKGRCLIDKTLFEKLRSLSERSNNYHISHFIFCGLFDDEQ